MKQDIRAFLVWLLKHFSNSNWLYEVPSPMPRYTQGQADKTVAAMVEMGILKEGSVALPIADTGSEDNLVDQGHFLIAEPLVLEDAVNLYIGDWIIASNPSGVLYAHHIVEMFVTGGVLEIKTRGTNCIADDPWWLTPNNLHYLVRGVLY